MSPAFSSALPNGPKYDTISYHHEAKDEQFLYYLFAIDSIQLLQPISRVQQQFFTIFKFPNVILSDTLLIFNSCI